MFLRRSKKQKNKIQEVPYYPEIFKGKIKGDLLIAALKK